MNRSIQTSHPAPIPIPQSRSPAYLSHCMCMRTYFYWYAIHDCYFYLGLGTMEPVTSPRNRVAKSFCTIDSKLCRYAPFSPPFRVLALSCISPPEAGEAHINSLTTRLHHGIPPLVVPPSPYSKGNAISSMKNCHQSSQWVHMKLCQPGIFALSARCALSGR